MFGANTHLANVMAGYTGTVFDYPDFASGLMSRPLPAYKLFRTAMPGWDNTPRRHLAGDVMVNSTPEAFERWLTVLVGQSLSQHTENDRFIFINAWNEWGEGSHLEPCRKWGHGYLEAVKRTLDHCKVVALPPSPEAILAPESASASIQPKRTPAAVVRSISASTISGLIRAVRYSTGMPARSSRA